MGLHVTHHDRFLTLNRDHAELFSDRDELYAREDDACSVVVHLLDLNLISGKGFDMANVVGNIISPNST